MKEVKENIQLRQIRLIVIIPAVFIILAVILSAVLVALPYFEKDSGESESPAVLYTVREHEGKIGVWNSDGKLRMIIDVSVSSLPDADRDELSGGFTVSSEEELMALVEDYSG